MFKGKMVTEAIPERVYALCKLVENAKSISTKDAIDMMEPKFLGNKSKYFGAYRLAAEELGLIKNVDNNLSLNVDPSVIQSTHNMRKYINSKICEFKDGSFYRVTNAYFNLGNKIFYGVDSIGYTGGESITELVHPLNKFYGINVDAVQLRGWRFWYSFLGFGYMQNMFAIPNPILFIDDAINNSNIEYGKKYDINNFLLELKPFTEIIIDIDSRSLNYGVSSALRALHDAGRIRLEHVMDYENAWSLYPMPLHIIDSTVTNITVCE